ncbi:DNA primase [Candidatus Uhrbacteria bacterium CG10_big_fil_rev_8_21_14_0_10_48_11]|uniref:DNA primase n=1 Tax=Candidatus Uhrbacteria bacterium CG10_big_fil_rev_8_21_14_0_10_48_11 TaxID=1975037 RepID=A0A2M8LDG9_9BACT|nr:MAG: DNA primase [Candidatus Uhrbacteria bacterium CG10_big_fil_rev_8_21_14_0_10_48_11]
MTPAEEIKSRLDIVDVLGEYIELKPSGANYKARCPFHQEKSASFMVSKPKQMWHCFGCGEGGDIFSFVMKQEGLEFPDALRLLGTKAGVRVTTEAPEKRTERERVGRVLAMAIQFWQETLWNSDEAREAREYLQNTRQILPATIRDWRLGFAPNSWDALVTFLAKQGVADEDMIRAGVAAHKMATRGRSVYDRFRNRIMFPLTNAHGQVVGATGRAMPGTEAEAKYVNTPETLLYKKGEVLYGLDRAKTVVRTDGVVIVVEGNVDVITSHQAGIKNVVAASGTALTGEQVRLIKRYTPKVAFAFDTDSAGEAATMRGLIAALENGLEVLLIGLPTGAKGKTFKDPDECIRENPELWRSAIAKAEPLLDTLFRRASEDRDLTKLEDKREVARSLLPVVARVPDVIAKNHYLKRLSALVGVPEGDLRQLLPASKSVTQRPAAASNVSSSRPIDVLRNLSERLIALVFAAPKEAKFVFDEIEPEFLAPELSALYKLMVVFYTRESAEQPPAWQGDAFRQTLANEPNAGVLLQTLDVLSLRAESDFSLLPEADIQRELNETVRRLRKRKLQERLQRLEQEIRIAESATPRDETRLRELVTQFQNDSAALTTLDF